MFRVSAANQPWRCRKMLRMLLPATATTQKFVLILPPLSLRLTQLLEPPPLAASVLRRIAARLGVSSWDFTAGAGPCDHGDSGVHCDCSFSNGTVCHVTEMYASLVHTHTLLFFKFALAAVFFDSLNQQNRMARFGTMIIFADSSRGRTSPVSSRLTSLTSPTSSSCELSIFRSWSS
jgi:hypothetical protein